jgi:hypothetical protein
MSMIHFDCIGTTDPYTQGCLYVSPGGVASWKPSGWTPLRDLVREMGSTYGSQLVAALASLRSRGADRSVFAHDGCRPAGILKYRRLGIGYGTESAVAESGCFVWPPFRGRGVALNLWRILLAAEAPGAVHAHAVTPAGLAMMRACVREFAGMTEWRVLVDGKLATADTRCVEAQEGI